MTVAAGAALGMTITLLQAPVAAAQEQDGRAPSLARDVADAHTRLEAARAEIATKQQSVNRTLVRLQLTRVEMDEAMATAAGRAAQRSEAQDELDSADDTLQDYSRQLYRQGVSPGAATDLLGTAERGTNGQRHEYLRRASADQQTVVEDLTESRDAAAARQAEADAALAEARARHTEATDQRESALADVDRVEAEVAALEEEVAALEEQFDLAVDPAEGAGIGREVEHGPGQPPRAQYSDYTPGPEEVERAENVARAMPEHGDLGEIRDFDFYAGAAQGIGSVADVAETVNAIQTGDVNAIVDQVMNAVMRADTGSIGPGAGQSPPGSQNPGYPPGQGSEAIERVITRGMSQIGAPYVWGGGNANGPTGGGFDCSGLMVYAFAGEGIALSKYSGDQYFAGRQVPVGERKRGDLLFWGHNGSRHVALYLGDGQMLEAQQSGVPVKVSPVRTSGGFQPNAVRLIE